MAKRRSNPASRRAKFANVRRIKLKNTIAIVTQADEYGRVCLLAAKQDPPGVSIKSNAEIVAEKIIYQPPFLGAGTADYLKRKLQPKINDRHTPIY